MTNQRRKRLGVTLATLGLVGGLTACGANGQETTSSGSTGDTSCPAGTLTAEGSSAQKNAIEEAIASFGESCLDADLSYNPTGSGAGIKSAAIAAAVLPFPPGARGGMRRGGL